MDFFFSTGIQPPMRFSLQSDSLPFSLSLHGFLHLFILIICISSSISEIHLFLDLLRILLSICFHSNVFLCVLLSPIRITWPSQAILVYFLNLTISAFSINSLSSWFIPILQDPPSFCTGPKIFLNILRSNILSFFRVLWVYYFKLNWRRYSYK